MTVRFKSAVTFISLRRTRRWPSIDDAALGYRLDIPAGTAVRFEPGQSREVRLVAYGGARLVFGFNQRVMGALPEAQP